MVYPARMKHAVGLVPGFLGFKDDYWGARFRRGLKAALAERGHDIHVEPFETHGLRSLATRQKKLRRRMSQGPAANLRWHLVGHSTGGLDALLLLNLTELEHHWRGGSTVSGKPLHVENLGSVVTLAAPIYGTGLASSATLGKGIKALFDAFAHSDGALRSRLAFVRAGMKAALKKIVLHDGLVADLRPENTSQLVTLPRRTDVPVYSIATCAPMPGDDHADALFRDLWRWTAAGNANDEMPPRPPMPATGWRWITSGVTPPINASANDGVVDTLRQHAGKLVAVVVGDHADVIGRYQRKEPPADAGLLHSGAQFGDAQLDELVAVIADCIAASIGDRITPVRAVT